MAEVLDRTDVDKRSPIYQRWQKEKNQAVYKNVLMDVEREEIIAFFEEKNIWYIGLLLSTSVLSKTSAISAVKLCFLQIWYAPAKLEKKLSERTIYRYKAYYDKVMSEQKALAE